MQPSRIHHVGLPVLTEAINLYRSAGYGEVTAFNDDLLRRPLVRESSRQPTADRTVGPKLHRCVGLPTAGS
jgi:hypothetical protein